MNSTLHPRKRLCVTGLLFKVVGKVKLNFFQICPSGLVLEGS